METVPKRRKRRKRGIDRRLLILFSIMPVGCLLALLIGVGITWFLFPTEYTNAEISDLSDDAAEEIVIMAAADYAEFQDLDRSRAILAELDVPNPAQYVALVAERLIRTNRGPIDPEIENVVRLAEALNVSTVSMVRYVSTPTPLPTNTPVQSPTPTFLPTFTPSPVVVVTNTPIPSDTSEEAATEEVSEEGNSDDGSVQVTLRQNMNVRGGPGTDYPVVASGDAGTTVDVVGRNDDQSWLQVEFPPDSGQYGWLFSSLVDVSGNPEVVAIAQAAAPPPTPTVAAPTDTPEPTATPVPDVDFIITEQRLLSKEENGGCAGNHNIFIDVIDAAGNPIDGVELGDEWGNPGPVTGHKGIDFPGHAVYDLYKDGGFKVFVKHDPTAGRSVTSEMTELLSSDDWKIGIPRLIEAGYCPDEATCNVLWNSGVFGVGNNSLCWGHYSWDVTFQRTW